MNARIHSTKFDQVENGMFFVVGCGRSGTTLMKSMLNAHPQIYLPHETSFFTGVSRGSFGTDATTVDEKIELMISKWWLADMRLSKESIRKHLGQQEGSWRNLFIAMMASLANDQAFRCFGEKTVNHVEYADELLNAYPSCRMIQVLRDPRAAFASFRAAPIGSNEVSQFVKDWTMAAEVDERLNANPRYHRVQFEHLILEPERIARSLCEFLKIEFDPGMMEFHKRKEPGYSPEQAHHQNTQKPIFRTGLEKWKNELSIVQVAMLEHYLGDPMRRIGYEMTGARTSFHSVRMAISTCRERLVKNLVRRPRQLLKACRAKKRQANV